MAVSGSSMSALANIRRVAFIAASYVLHRLLRGVPRHTRHWRKRSATSPIRNFADARPFYLGTALGNKKAGIGHDDPNRNSDGCRNSDGWRRKKTAAADARNQS